MRTRRHVDDAAAERAPAPTAPAATSIPAIARSVAGPAHFGLDPSARFVTNALARDETKDAAATTASTAAAPPAAASASAAPTGASAKTYEDNRGARDTPSGTVKIAAGAHSGDQPYGDPRNKHTKVANYTSAEIKAGLAAPPTDVTHPIAAMAAVMNGGSGKGAYGSQMTKEATDSYETLVKDALTSGTAAGGGVTHTASVDVGFSIFDAPASATATKNYKMYPMHGGAHGGGGGWHIFPN